MRHQFKAGDKVRYKDGEPDNETRTVSSVLQTCYYEDGRWDHAKHLELVEPAPEPQEYEVGKWYGWNGGECPVHPNTIGDIKYADGIAVTDEFIWNYEWDKPLLFRITKLPEEKREPRDFWIVDGSHIYTSEKAAREDAEQWGNDEIIHVREVIE